MTTHSDNYVNIVGSTPRITLVDQDSTQPDYRFVNGGNTLKLRFGVPSIGTGWQDGTEIAAFEKDHSISFQTERIVLKYGTPNSGTFSISDGSTRVLFFDADHRLYIDPLSFEVGVSSGARLSFNSSGKFEISNTSQSALFSGAIYSDGAIVADSNMTCRKYLQVERETVGNTPPSYYVLTDTDGSKWFLWVATGGTLRIAEASAPTYNNQSTHGDPV